MSENTLSQICLPPSMLQPPPPPPHRNYNEEIGGRGGTFQFKWTCRLTWCGNHPKDFGIVDKLCWFDINDVPLNSSLDPYKNICFLFWHSFERVANLCKSIVAFSVSWFTLWRRKTPSNTFCGWSRNLQQEKEECIFSWSYATYEGAIDWDEWMRKKHGQFLFAVTKNIFCS